MKKSGPGSNRGCSKKKFTEDEDNIIRIMVEQKKFSWKQIARCLNKRSPRQCRERWNHYLSKNIDSTEWTAEEDELLLSLYKEYGPKWTKIADNIKGRTSVNVKNRYALLTRHKKKEEKFKTDEKFDSIFEEAFKDIGDDSDFVFKQ